MTTINDGGLAFPDPARAGGACMETGMSLRDWFASQERLGDESVSVHVAEALMGSKMPVGPDSLMDRLKWWAEAAARYKYMCADAMLAARVQK